VDIADCRGKTAERDSTRERLQESLSERGPWRGWNSHQRDTRERERERERERGGGGWGKERERESERESERGGGGQPRS
jgi:hypothetical protein